jgi:hypothetical protein
MADEIASDIASGALYLSPRLTPSGRRDYPKMLAAAAAKGSPDSLAAILRPLMAAKEMSTSKTGKPYEKNVPVNAAESLAEGEFNRFYVRAVCLTALANGCQEVEVYRAKPVSTPRPESEARIGKRIDAAKLLADVRTTVRTDTALGVPAGPNSGLSAKLF